MKATEFKPALLIAKEIAASVERIRSMEVEALMERIAVSETIFVAGGGRSGLMIRSFAMRLMQMGVNVHVVGETVTPAIGPSDLLIIGSGSGETKSLVSMAHKAKDIGSSVALLTIQPESSIGRLADTVVRLPGTTKDHGSVTLTTVQPMASLFEQTLLVLLDGIVLKLMETADVAPGQMLGRHANLE